jgi:D-3-phosphoglycerate dehydrogenase / 2-oxoglutarate reductase
MRPKVWTEYPLHPDALPRLQAVAEVVAGKPDNLAGADAAVIGASIVDADFIERAGPSLKLVIRHGIGYNTLDVPTATRYGVLAANTPDGPTESTAEHAAALILALAKTVVLTDRLMREGEPWSRARLFGIELRGRTLGVVGYGRIGRRVAEICGLGLGMRIMVYDPFVSDPARLPAGIELAASLDALLAQADFVTLHTPLSAETWHLIGERELGLLRPGSYLVNVSRGPVVDEAALIRALESGHLAGAGLDVFDVEPLSVDSPLLQMRNVVLTPHIASNTDQGYFKMSSSVVDQVLQVLAGECPAHLIDPACWPSPRFGAA